MIDAQAENMVQDMARRMQGSQGLSLDMYLKVHRHDCRQMKEQAHPDAEKIHQTGSGSSCWAENIRSLTERLTKK